MTETVHCFIVTSDLDNGAYEGMFGQFPALADSDPHAEVTIAFWEVDDD
jgi:hypothetical protein